MAIVSRDGSNDEVTGINVAPLVDVALVLLIIFLVTAKAIVSQSLSLELPAASQGTSTEGAVLRVTMRADGSTLVDGATVPGDDAVLALSEAARAKSPDVRVVLDIESTVMHGRVAHVLDLLKEARVSHVGFGVMPEREARGP